MRLCPAWAAGGPGGTPGEPLGGPVVIELPAGLVARAQAAQVGDGGTQ